jgi:hypothetical protein
VNPPPEEELAAIVVAIETAWPRPAVISTHEERPNRWRFSGRWWARPVTARRERPSVR